MWLGLKSVGTDDRIGDQGREHATDYLLNEALEKKDYLVT